MKLRAVWKKAFIVAVFLAAAGAGWILAGRIHAPARGVRAPATIPGKIPLQETVLRLIEPLRYSVLPAMLDPEVTLEVDFAKRVWTLKNFRHYNEKGELLLVGGRYGLCAELATYVFQQLKPLLGERYLLEFVRATEPDFFNTLQSNHIILVLSDRANGETFMLDPSFHRYGRPGAFSNYALHGAKDVLEAFQKNDRDVTLSVGDTLPLMIRNDSLVVFSVEAVKGLLDRENIALAISARRRQSSSGRYLFVLRKEAGKVDALKEEPVLELLLSPEERTQLAQKLLTWMQSL